MGNDVSINININNQTNSTIVYDGKRGDEPETHANTINIPPKTSNSQLYYKLPGRSGTYYGWFYLHLERPEQVHFLLFAHFENQKLGWWGAALNDKGGRDQDHSNAMPERRIGTTTHNNDNHTLDITLHDSDFAFIHEVATAHWWMGSLVETKKEAVNWPLSYFRLPGSHDAGSFGKGTPGIENNWKCQDLDFKQQLEAGIRYFDLRLLPEDGQNANNTKWYPFHGKAPQTGPEIRTLLDQIVLFLSRHDSEFFIIDLQLDSLMAIANFWQIIFEKLEQHLIPAHRTNMPTYAETVKKGRHIIMTHNRNHDGNGGLLVGDIGDKWNEYMWRKGELILDGPYADDPWNKGSPQLVLQANLNFITENSAKLSQHAVFWIAQCQLTPSLGSSEFIYSPSYSPRNLAAVANPFTREQVVQKSEWRQYSSITMIDFGDVATTMPIAALSFTD